MNCYHIALLFFIIRVRLLYLGVPKLYISQRSIIEVFRTYYFCKVFRVIASTREIILNTWNVHTLICCWSFHLKLTTNLSSLRFPLVVLLLQVIILLDTHLRHRFHHKTFERRKGLSHWHNISIIVILISLHVIRSHSLKVLLFIFLLRLVISRQSLLNFLILFTLNRLFDDVDLLTRLHCLHLLMLKHHL